MSRLLNFFSLTDYQGNLSLTNLAVWILLVKLVTVQNAGMPDIAAFFFAILNYAHKRVTSAQAAEQESAPDLGAVEDLQRNVDTIKNTLSTVQLAVGIKSLK